jgi:tetratricopeptide (TPR) repeat protein
MKWCFFLALLQACIFNVGASENISSKADELLEASLFEEAIIMYQLVLQDTHDESIQHYIRLKLAQAYFAESKYAETVLLLNQIPDQSSQEITQAKLYLLGLAYKNLLEYNQAINAFNEYLQCTEQPAALHFYDEVQYELGHCYFLNQDWVKSRSSFDALSPNKEKENLHCLAQIYLARIDLSQTDYFNAQQRLSALDQQIPQDSLLRYELSYWQGEASYQQKDYPKAAESFELAIPKRRFQEASWYGDTLYQLGWSYLKLGESSLDHSEMQKLYFENSEKQLTTLLDYKPEEKVYLALAKLYIEISKKQHDSEALKKADAILSNAELFLSLESQANVLWLKADSSSDYQTKNLLYKKATDETFRETSLYPYGWYVRGLNDFNEGSRLMKAKTPVEAFNKFEVASYAFKQAFNLLKTKDRQTAGLAMKYLSEAYHYFNTQEGKLKAFSVLDQLINQHKDILQAYDDPSEIYYLHAALAVNLTTWQPGDKFADIAEHSLVINRENYPKSLFAVKSLYLLGNVLYHKKDYVKAEEAFNQLAAICKDAGFCQPLVENVDILGDSYFWVAKSITKQKEHPDRAKEYKRKVFEEYPKSTYAAEAYFTYYNYRDYLHGDRTAMKHLLDFEQKFPNSPFSITAYYLIGMDYKRDRKTAEGKWIRKKNLIEAIEAFQASETAFDQFQETNSFPQEELSYFINIRYHCTLERALANLAIAEESQGAKKRIFLDYAEEVFKQIVSDFKNQNHPLTKKLMYREPYPRLLEESSYWLAQTYTKAQNDEAAELVFSEMLENYRSVKITRGYLLSKTRYDLGLIAMRKKNYPVALELFAKAEDAAKGKILSVDQKIDLWIQQSLCHRELSELDRSMLLLSKAINDDAISSLRIKAMYLRAEIYALQGRHELARKQLEAASKNGGEWALKAKHKLDEDYGYQ